MGDGTTTPLMASPWPYHTKMMEASKDMDGEPTTMRLSTSAHMGHGAMGHVQEILGVPSTSRKMEGSRISIFIIYTLLLFNKTGRAYSLVF